jgi:exopolyphosphatase/guanosine-5'-triphosphate,3'-diphosphate pyrophosphatase
VPEVQLGHVDTEQARRVTATAMDFFDQVAPSQSWGETQRTALRCAVQMQEVGFLMGYSGHHKHGAYLVENAELPVFSIQFKTAVSKLILAHRDCLNRGRVAPLGPPGSPGANWAILLRLAVRLHRRRSEKKLPILGLEFREQGPLLKIPSDWLAQRPLTQADLIEEARACLAVGRLLEFG